MKFLKKTLKTLLCASLVLSLGISATACSTDDNPEGTGNPPTGDGPVYVEPPFTPPDDGSEGIDWTKYWDGVTSVSGSTDNFSFTKSIDIGTVDVGNTDPGSTSGEAVEVFDVRFDGNGGEGAATQTVNSGSYAIKPTTPQRSGYMFVDWLNGTEHYDFNAPVTKDLSLNADWAAVDSKIKSVEAFNESLTVTWTDSNPTSASVQYKAAGSNDWITVDAPLVRKADSSTARVDIMGLPAGGYNVKITPSSGSAIELPSPVTVDAYDRSGYAHFNYTDGVGAYTDEGAIKSNTLVIYLTNENKNDVLDSCYVDGQKVDITQYVTDASNVVHKGIGEILNNRRYSGNDRSNVGIGRLTHVYGAVSLRIIGEVENLMPNGICDIIGLTDYNSTGNGGTVGDSGGMARMVNAKNLTIEGVGDDAVVKGWGFHFVSSTLARVSADDGKSFEARNLIFKNYPEDALGMEGEQSTKSTSSDISASVERCWVHNNTFYQGGNGAAAESDKGEGDGSCDFKRGQFYTFSYNYLEACHKTNLIGSAKTSLQYNISMHHNIWNDCQSRIPLVRNANVHFYNNYVLVTSEAAKASYVHSVRANAYLYSEYNYYDGCKTVAEQGGEGGNTGIKGYNDTYYACYKGDDTTIVADREAKVSNGCQYAYGKIDYSSFDTDPNLFYYDATNKKSDCLLDDAVTARTRVLITAGAQDKGTNSTAMNENTPTTSVQTSGDKTDIEIPTTKPTATVNGVMFTNLTGTSSGTVKGKGQIVTFTLGAEAAFTITATASNADQYPELISSNGTVYANKINGTVTVVLPKGTYIITTGQKDKEATISAMSFADTAASAAERVASAQAALAAIPSIVTLNSGTTITEAQLAYSALLSSEREQIDSDVYNRYLKAVKAYEELKVDYVIARIDYIGTVTADSYVKINAAQKAYSNLSSEQQSSVTNKSTLDAAWDAFGGFEVLNVINRLNDLPNLTASDVNIKSSATVEKLYDWFNAVQTAYDALKDDDGDDKRGEVPAESLKKLTDGLAELKNVEGFLAFKETLENTAVEDATTVGGNLVSLYNGLTDAQKAKLSAEENTKYEAIKAAYEDFASKAVFAVYNSSTNILENTNGGQTFTLVGGNPKTYKATETSKTITVNGTQYLQAFEFNSGSTITFNLAEGATKTLKIYTSTATVSKEVIIGGKKYSGKLVQNGGDSYGLIEIELTGTGEDIVITRSSTPVIFIMELI
ncbi:MAG: InlB B-repeat-containing protein [Clostridia bacterium]|nr:InlB B-repeat-containing protein [Clostridia bacterium]